MEKKDVIKTVAGVAVIGAVVTGGLHLLQDSSTGELVEPAPIEEIVEDANESELPTNVTSDDASSDSGS